MDPLRTYLYPWVFIPLLLLILNDYILPIIFTVVSYVFLLDKKTLCILSVEFLFMSMFLVRPCEIPKLRALIMTWVIRVVSYKQGRKLLNFSYLLNIVLNILIMLGYLHFNYLIVSSTNIHLSFSPNDLLFSNQVFFTLINKCSTITGNDV